jgi:translation initiation factor 5B
MIRQPIVAILGHVDHGKTLILDKIRGSTVVDKEAGAITQHSGASEVPMNKIKTTCGKLLDKISVDLGIPGLLFLDNPGHEAFTAIRKRGSSIADLAVLVIDVNEGFQPQTDESLEFLKEFKTPFIVAANKIDRIHGWVSYPNECFFESFQKQPEHIRQAVEESIYKIVGQLSERGFECERFDRVEDFKKAIAIVPTSGKTGEGIQELLMMLTGLAQSFLKGKLEIGEKGEGSILEVKEYTGLGKTIDVILYNGKVSKNNFLVTGGREPIITKIRALLKPKPLKEIRIEKDFDSVETVTAAAGIKISAPGLDGAIAGSPIRFVKTKEEAEEVAKELKKCDSHLEFDKTTDGVILRADTLGSLEALIHMLNKRGISVKKAEVGPPVKRDIIEAEAVKDRYKKVIFAFNVKSAEIKAEAKDHDIQLFDGNVIYTLFENYDKWLKTEQENERQEKIKCITMPCIFKVIPGFVFRASDPAVVGVEILDGCLRTGVRLRNGKKEIGTVKELQKDSENVTELKKGERGAVSILGGNVGRNIKEGDELSVIIRENDLKLLAELKMPTDLAKKALEME